MNILTVKEFNLNKVIDAQFQKNALGYLRQVENVRHEILLMRGSTGEENGNSKKTMKLEKIRQNWMVYPIEGVESNGQKIKSIAIEYKRTRGGKRSNPDKLFYRKLNLSHSVACGLRSNPAAYMQGVFEDSKEYKKFINSIYSSVYVYRISAKKIGHSEPVGIVVEYEANRVEAMSVVKQSLAA